MKTPPGQLKILLYCISRHVCIYRSNPVSQTARWLKTTPDSKCQGFPLSLSNCWAALRSLGCLWSPLCGILKSFKTKTSWVHWKLGSDPVNTFLVVGNELFPPRTLRQIKAPLESQQFVLLHFK